MDQKDEIKARLPIDQLVAQYCQLKRKGRSFVAICPFHNDSKPSLLVSPDKGIAYCFACQSGGDIFSFVQKIEGIDFPAALALLADKAGVTLIRDASRATKPSVNKDEKQRMRECLEAAQKFYAGKLRSTPVASEYIVKRGVPDELIQTFGIGYAPDSFSETYDHLLKAGYSRLDIVSSGLGVQKDLNEERIYDRFRHRIQFPILDAQGAVIGFGGRAMGDSDAKYVNSPESPLYNKSNVLFGLFQARDAIRSSRRVIVVEGYFDAIAAHKAGIHNVVAVSGTALTEEHVKIIKRYADEVVLCLDQDNAGQLAASRAFGLLAEAQVQIFSVTLPAKDPDELVQRDSELFHKIITEKPVPYLDAIINHLCVLPDRHEPAGKRHIAETLFPLLEALPTSVELRAYLEKAAREFGIVTSEFESDFRAFTKTGGKNYPVREKSVQQIASFSTCELALGLALLYPSARGLLHELIPLENAALEKIRVTVAGAGEEKNVLTILTFNDIDPILRERMQVLTLYCEENFPLWSEAMAQKEIKQMCMAANRECIVRRQTQLITELKEARAQSNTDEEARLLMQYQQLLKLAQMAKVTSKLPS